MATVWIENEDGDTMGEVPFPEAGELHVLQATPLASGDLIITVSTS